MVKSFVKARPAAEEDHGSITAITACPEQQLRLPQAMWAGTCCDCPPCMGQGYPLRPEDFPTDACSMGETILVPLEQGAACRCLPARQRVSHCSAKLLSSLFHPHCSLRNGWSVPGETVHPAPNLTFLLSDKARTLKLPNTAKKGQNQGHNS